MTDRELLQQALDALQGNWRTDESDKASEAIRARLAQPEQKPVSQETLDYLAVYEEFKTKAQPEQRTGDCVLTGVCAAEGHRIQKAQPEQEQDGECQHCDGSGCSACHSAYLVDINQQREWQGLTDEELRNAYCEVSGKEWCLGGISNAETFYEAIEAKLKEKNGF